MAKKVIKFSLSDHSIDNAIDELELYKQELQEKIDKYRNKIADEISKMVSLNFSSAVLDDKVRGGTRKADVTVEVQSRGDILVVVANGEDAVWCEFGAGVYHNGSAGSSPNPYGNNLGFTIGSYGKGHGKQTAWGYYEDGQLVITRGTPASMPMYNAAQDVMKRAIEIAREVFGS
jgi:hypothetical protein